MTEKRFNYVAFDGFEDNGEYITPYQVVDLLNELHEENKQLKEDNKILNQINDKVNGWNGLAHDKIFKLEKENEQLKQRNDRQAKQLDNLYRLIEKKDWRTLSDILDDFKRCEEQLQRESGTYW